MRCAPSTPAGVRCTFVISAALSVVGIAPARARPVAPPIALAVSITRPPPSATIIPSPPTSRQQLGAQLVDQPGPDVVHLGRALDHLRRGVLRPLGRQQHVALGQQLGSLREPPAPEVDHPLAVVPREAAH